MQTYIGTYQLPDNTIINATILLLKEHISIGYNDINDLHKKEIWQYADIHHQFVFMDGGATVINNSKFPRTKITIPKQNVTAAINALQTQDARPWIVKTFTAFRIKLLIVFAALIGLLVLAYILFVPYLSEQLAKKLPKKYEISLGNTMFNAIVDTTKRDAEKTVLANDYFKKLNIASDYPIHITVLKDPTVNAFAIMGGNIVLYTGLLDKMTHHEELAAVLVHEFTHIEHQHTTRSIFRSLSSKVFLSLLLGNMGNLTAIVLSNTDQFTGLHYSRKLEKESDENGLALLTKQHINAEGFIFLFQHLQEASGKTIPEFLSSHPDTEKRIQYIQDNPIFSKGEKTTLNTELEVLFKAIKGEKEEFSF